MFKELPQFNLKLPYHTFWSILGKIHRSKSNQFYFHSGRIICVYGEALLSKTNVRLVDAMLDLVV